MTDSVHRMAGEDLKSWLLSQDFPAPREHLPKAERLKIELEDLGYEQVRVEQVGDHPVWTFSGRIGGSRFEHDFIIQVLLKKIARSMGYTAKMREIVVHVRRGRFSGAICLDDGVRVPVEAIVGDDQDD